MSIDVGDDLPDVDADRRRRRRSGCATMSGKPLVLYFYPKDDTAGCTREAQDFSAALPTSPRPASTVLGVSKDTPAKHAKFTAKYDLTVPLASDDDGSVLRGVRRVGAEERCTAANIWGSTARPSCSMRRASWSRAWRKVKVPGHVEQVLAAVKELG